MKFSYLPPYGHACCPQCKLEFDLVGAVPTIVEDLPHNDSVIYMMCPNCHLTYETADDASRKAMANRCFVNYKQKELNPNGAVYPWAVTTWLILKINDLDPVTAIENGHGFTRDQYSGICSDEIGLSVLPGGLLIMSSTTTNPEVA